MYIKDKHVHAIKVTPRLFTGIQLYDLFSDN